MILSVSEDSTLKLWDAATGACLGTFYAEGMLTACAWGADGQIAVGDGVGKVLFLRVS